MRGALAGAVCFLALVVGITATPSLIGCDAVRGLTNKGNGDESSTTTHSEAKVTKLDDAALEARAVEAAEQQAQTPAPKVAAQPRDHAMHFDLLGRVHLADVRGAKGLVVDFGTPARMKYTNGEWNSGWGTDRVANGVSVSSIARVGNVFVPVEGKQGFTLTLRYHSNVGGALVVYANEKTVGQIDLAPGAPGEFVTKSIQVPASLAPAGEVRLKLRATQRRDASAVEFDWLMVSEGVGAEVTSAPSSVATPTTVGGVERKAVQIEPGGSVSWFVEQMPQNALVWGAAVPTGATGEGALNVTWAQDGETPKVIHEQTLGARWSDVTTSLNQPRAIGRLRFENTSSVPVVLSDARIVVPHAPAEKQAAAEAAGAAGAATQATNVIVLLVDTLRASKLQLYYPKSRVKTPVFDAFAKDGLVFNRPAAPENWTKPSVASVLTSLHPVSHHTKTEPAKLPQELLMLSEVFKKAGFTTSSFIANGYVSNAFGFDQGWDHYTNYIRESRSTTARNVFGEAEAWIRKNKGKRFFAYIQTIDPHVPYDPPERYITMYDPEPYNGKIRPNNSHLMLDDEKKNPGKYNLTERDKQRLEVLHDGEISYHDEYFGKFLAALKEMGLRDNTIIVITSDHGEEFQEHGSWGHGHSVYQELLHVPLMVRWPGVIPAGTRVEPVVTTLDIGPTVLEAAGVAIPDEFEGRSLLGFTRNQPPTGPYVGFSDFLDNRRVIRGGDLKLIVRASLTHTLFDLADDYWEKNELSVNDRPIGGRYLRILSGQFLGADDKRHWPEASSAESSVKRPRRRAAPKGTNTQELNPELCRQLVSLGYISDECSKILKQ